jgi:hypothetical protein
MRFFLLFFLYIGLDAADYDTFVKESGRKNLALKKSYTWNFAPNAFPDGYSGNSMCNDEKDHIQLTDGRYASNTWFDTRTVGWWHGGSYVNITIDLGESHAIGTVAIRCSSEKAGLRVPEAVRIFTSDEPDRFILAGESLKEANLRS